jgi:hypothetical protein
MTTYPPCTERARRRFSRTQHVTAPPADVFPLLCPVREFDWIPEWDCRLVYTESGIAEPGCIFQTDRPADGGLDTWVVSHHEAPRHIAFVRVNPLRAMQYDIGLEPAGNESTRLTWQQVITSLSEEGDRHVAAARESDFAAAIAKLEGLLNGYLGAGRAA